MLSTNRKFNEWLTESWNATFFNGLIGEMDSVEIVMIIASCIQLLAAINNWQNYSLGLSDLAVIFILSAILITKSILFYIFTKNYEKFKD